MHALEERAIKALSKCTMGIGTSSKRFVRDMKARLDAASEFDLTAKQKLFLWRIAFHYRQQLYNVHAEKDVVWLAQVITGQTDKKHPVPDRYLEDGSGFFQQKFNEIASAYVEGLKG